MSEIHIHKTYGAIFGMDLMCDGTIAGEVFVGDVVRIERDGEPIELQVAALDGHRDHDGSISDLVGIGLRGENAENLAAGDRLYVVPGAPISADDESE